MDAPLIKRLAELGLGAHEAKVYAALLEESPSGAASIAKRSGLPRSSVYTTLAVLQAKGIVGVTHKNTVKQFVAEGHLALVDHLERERELADKRLGIAETLREELERRTTPLSLSSSGRQDGIVKFEGQEGLRRIYLAMLREAQTGSTLKILRDEFIWQPEWSFVHEKAWTDRVRKLKANKDLSTQLLVNGSAIERKQHGLYLSRSRTNKHETRILPKNFQANQFALYLIQDAVSILSVERGNLVGVKISDRHLARNVGSLYDAMWGLSKPVR